MKLEQPSPASVDAERGQVLSRPSYPSVHIASQFCAGLVLLLPAVALVAVSLFISALAQATWSLLLMCLGQKPPAPPSEQMSDVWVRELMTILATAGHDG